MIPELTTEGPHLMQLLGPWKFHISQKSHQANIWLMQLLANLFHYCNLANAFLGYLSSTLLFSQIEPLKNGALLILPSSIARNSSAPNAKMIFEIPWGILEGCTNSAWPSEKLPKWHFLIRAWNLKFFWAKWLHMSHSLTLSKKSLRLHPAPSNCLSERINWII